MRAAPLRDRSVSQKIMPVDCGVSPGDRETVARLCTRGLAGGAFWVGPKSANNHQDSSGYCLSGGSAVGETTETVKARVFCKGLSGLDYLFYRVPDVAPSGTAPPSTGRCTGRSTSRSAAQPRPHSRLRLTRARVPRDVSAVEALRVLRRPIPAHISFSRHLRSRPLGARCAGGGMIDA